MIFMFLRGNFIIKKKIIKRIEVKNQGNAGNY